YRAERPGDTVVEAAVTDADTDTVVLHQIDGTGLSTLDESVVESHQRNGFQAHDVEVPARRLDAILEDAGWPGLDIHFMVIDVEGAEASVLASVDLTTWRPWVLVIESTKPLTTEQTQQEWEDVVLRAGYQFTLFDGLSRFYVAEERAATLGPILRYPASIHDDYTTRHYRALERERDALDDDNQRLRKQVESLVSAVVRWRRAAWEAAVAEPAVPVDDWARQELDATRATLSWRITKPLRAVRGAGVRRPG
ncbi:MAG: FkbM family methyltransferase, partial [Actinobacteria bacterium]|nr:FkbM family methyltransferase [Actinomycetota bacterium]